MGAIKRDEEFLGGRAIFEVPDSVPSDVVARKFYPKSIFGVYRSLLRLLGETDVGIFTRILENDGVMIA